MVRYPRANRTRIYDVESMRVATPSGALVPFTEVARIKEGTGYGSIVRKNQKRAVTVTADCDQAVTNAENHAACGRPPETRTLTNEVRPSPHPQIRPNPVRRRSVRRA